MCKRSPVLVSESCLDSAWNGAEVKRAAERLCTEAQSVYLIALNLVCPRCHIGHGVMDASMASGEAIGFSPCQRKHQLHGGFKGSSSSVPIAAPCTVEQTVGLDSPTYMRSACRPGRRARLSDEVCKFATASSSCVVDGRPWDLL